MLRESQACNFEAVLERLKDTGLRCVCEYRALRRCADMLEESIILYGKLELHEKALHLLVHRLGDHKAAELYCHENTVSKDRPARQRLFMALLRVYLVPEAGKRDYTQEAINLLNGHLSDLDMAKAGPRTRDAGIHGAQVLELVPQSWSIGTIAKFLKRSVRISMHLHRTTQIEESLARCARRGVAVG